MTAGMTSPAIGVRGLRKRFGEHVVLDGIDLAVGQGSVYALLGPNGAGKTTFVHILSTLISADEGELLVDGHDVRTEPNAVRAVIGLTGQFSAVDQLFSGRENLTLMADLRHLGRTAGQLRVEELLVQFDLVDAAQKPVATYSGGMRRRLDLAMTLMGNPRIIFLDEPTAGLDPRSRRTMWDTIRDLADRGATILLTTQYLDEADRLADRIAFLDNGRIVAEGTPAELKRLVPGGQIRLEFAGPEALDQAAALLASSHRDDVGLALAIDGGGLDSLRSVLDRLDADSITIAGLSVRAPDLDDVFLSLTGAAGRADPGAQATSPHVAGVVR
jgi:ABC-2 type transport system ATP-binding protein